MRFKQFLQLFTPPIYYRMKDKMSSHRIPTIHPLPQIVHSSKRMVVIGNGPSMRETMKLYAKELQEFDTIMVNFSANTEMYEQIKPSVYMLVDPAWYLMPDHMRDSIFGLYEAIVKKTTWQMIIVMPYKAKGSYAIKRFSENPNLHIVFYEDGYLLPEGVSQFEAWDKNLISPPTQTVLNSAIWLSIYWGYEETYIVGADSSWIKDTYVDQHTNRVYTIDSHFYKNNDVYKDEDLFEEKRRYLPAKYHEELETTSIAFKSYWDLREYADWKGVMVYNASEYSWIDAFERKKLS